MKYTHVKPRHASPTNHSLHQLIPSLSSSLSSSSSSSSSTFTIITVPLYFLFTPSHPSLFFFLQHKAGTEKKVNKKTCTPRQPPLPNTLCRNTYILCGSFFFFLSLSPAHHSEFQRRIYLYIYTCVFFFFFKADIYVTFFFLMPQIW